MYLLLHCHFLPTHPFLDGSLLPLVTSVIQKFATPCVLHTAVRSLQSLQSLQCCAECLSQGLSRMSRLASTVLWYRVSFFCNSFSLYLIFHYFPLFSIFHDVPKRHVMNISSEAPKSNSWYFCPSITVLVFFSLSSFCTSEDF